MEIGKLTQTATLQAAPTARDRKADTEKKKTTTKVKQLMVFVMCCHYNIYGIYICFDCEKCDKHKKHQKWIRFRKKSKYFYVLLKDDDGP